MLKSIKCFMLAFNVLLITSQIEARSSSDDEFMEAYTTTMIASLGIGSFCSLLYLIGRKAIITDENGNEHFVPTNADIARYCHLKSLGPEYERLWDQKNNVGIITNKFIGKVTAFFFTLGGLMLVALPFMARAHGYQD